MVTQEQRLRQAQWSSSIFQNTVEYSMPREQLARAQSREGRDTWPRATELIERVRGVGLTIGYRYDDKIPFDVRMVIKDLMFELAQKANKVTHLQKKTTNLQWMSRVHKREESEEQDCPLLK